MDSALWGSSIEKACYDGTRLWKGSSEIKDYFVDILN